VPPAFVLLGDPIKRGAERPAGVATTVTAERLADGFHVGAALHGDREHNGRIARVGIGGAVRLVIIEEQLADAAVRVSAKGRGVVQAADTDLGDGAGQIRLRLGG
jgi:hypothetical protein